MENNQLNSPNFLHKGRGKDKHLVELEKVYKSLFEKPQTMKEVDKAIGVMRESICWYCRSLRKANKLFKVRQRKCTVTGYPHVWELTTNPAKAPKHSLTQQTLF